MRTVRRRVIAVFAVLLLCSGHAVRAENEDTKSLYTWTDSQGVVHMTDSLDKVPAKYRPKAERTEQSPAGENVIQETGGASSPQPTESDGGDENSKKAEWQARMLDAKRRLQYAEDKYQQLVKRKTDLQDQWGSSGAALPPQEVLDEMKQLDEQITAAKEEVDKAHNLIDNVIPDEARRAGIPPGWLREVE
jgi:hypothetical protein